MVWCSRGRSPLISASVRVDHVPGTAESMSMGLSLSGAMVSSVMSRARWVARSSLCSMRMVPTKRVMAASFGISAQRRRKCQLGRCRLV